MTTMCRIGGDPSQLPLDLEALQTDDAALGDPRPDSLLGKWRSEVQAAPAELIDTDTALIAIYAGKVLRQRRRWTNRRAALARWTARIWLALFVVGLLLVLLGCAEGGQRAVTRQVTESLVQAPPVAVDATTVPTYSDNYFGGGRWASAADGPAGTDCTVRGLVLYAETVASGHTPIDGDDRDKCLEDGKFVDIYTGETVDPERHDEEVDHVLARHDAWVLGAWRWSREQRWAFSNDQANLRATTGAVNGGQKGSKGPDEWRPSARSGWCEYAVTYEATATRWSLPISPARQAALGEMKATC